MRKWYLLLISLVAAAVLFVALSLSYEDTDSKVLKLKDPVQVVLKSVEGQPMDFWDIVIRGIDEASREFGIPYEISGPRYEREINKQIKILQSIIDKHPPLIILAASDYKKLVYLVGKAGEMGIPVITLDSGVDSPVPVSFIATDNVAAGRKAGEEMKRLLQNKERKSIAIVSHIKETATAIDREAGVREALNDANISGTWFCDVDPVKAYRITLELLKSKSIGGIVALNEVATLGVARAVEEKGMQDRVAVVGFDNAVKELSFLEAGVIKATVVQKPYNMGYMTIKTAYEYLKGVNVPDFIDTGSILITKDNMFKREYQEILFPFGGKKGNEK